MKKIYIVTLLPIATISFVIANNVANYSKSINNEVSDKKLNSKIIRRSFSFQNSEPTSFNSSGSEENILNKKHEIKILLKYKVKNFNSIKEDSKQYSLNNNKYLKILLSKLTNVESTYASRLSPYIWITFKNLSDKEKALKPISSEEFVFSIFLNNNEYYNVKPNNYKNTQSKISRFSDNQIDDKLRKMNFIQQKNRENDLINNSKYINSNSKIGILEVVESARGESYVDNSHDTFKNTKIYKYENDGKPGQHASLVAAMAAGKNGVDRFASIYSAGFKKLSESDWNKKIEWMVIDNDVKVINHSYGSNSKNVIHPYEERAFFLDYISRKYGVINVFASGNSHNENNAKKYIQAFTLSFNSIVVGSSNNDWEFKASDFSNRLKDKEYVDLPKPLVVAPGEKNKIKGIYDNIDTDEIQGTSYSAPLVSGAISSLLRIKSNLNNENRVSAIKAILAASARNSNVTNEAINANGLKDSIGAGIIDFEKMLEASNNLINLNVNKNKKNEVLYSNEISLKRGEKIQIASSWLFNAGIVKSGGERPEFYNIHDSSPFTGSGGMKWADHIYNSKMNEWNSTYNSTNALKKDETFKRQNNNFFSNYDLYLEKKSIDTIGNELYSWPPSWETVKSIGVVKSNVELIRYTSKSPGTYRIKIVKKQDSIFDNSIDDIISLTYVKKE